MNRLAVAVEGETPQEFNTESTKPHLRRSDMYPTPVLIGGV
ncbi:MAG: hypothetical protein OXN97_03765 [Bryobacterales bacterium]|nr:hypothetical protein [Bryobacterales bacterium]MDE0629699.1 hypothetical protein [Bryobacterales bacterium]